MPSPLHPTRCNRRKRDPRYYVLQKRPPLPSTSYEYWHGEIGASAASAVGQIVGHTLTGNGTPSVAADGAHFKGKTVYQSAVTGSKGWTGTGLTTTLAIGSRPYVAAICRTRTLVTADGGDITAFDVGGSAPDDQQRLIYAGNAGTDVFRYSRRFQAATRSASSGDIQDTNVHFFELYIDATLGIVLVMDGVQIANSAAFGVTAGLESAVNRFSIGRLAAVSANYSDTSLAFLLVCSAKPSYQERLALRAYARGYWGSL